MEKIDNIQKYQRLISLFPILFSLLLVFCIVSCEGDPDYLAKLDAEVAWHNAYKLEVIVAFPEAWGFSPQRGTDRCRDDIHNVTPRTGYSFTVHFDPNPAYSNAEWKAYKTN
ncbi:MAG: hypothetical protein FWD13_04665 [Treponema sp.]|nr:hypothetical protein [Treponema sp.]